MFILIVIFKTNKYKSSLRCIKTICVCFNLKITNNITINQKLLKVSFDTAKNSVKK